MTKAARVHEPQLFGHLGFVILSTFLIRNSSLARASARRLLQFYERSEIRLPPTAEEPRLRGRGSAHPRAGHRCEHGNFQRRKRRIAPSAAVQGTGAARD